MPSSSVQVETERSNSLRIRLEDGSVVQHAFPASKIDISGLDFLRAVSMI